jgi:dimethylamine/trimethylamine dehydrogenase
MTRDTRYDILFEPLGIYPESRLSAAEVIEFGVNIVPLHLVARLGPASVSIACVFTDRERENEAGTVVPVAMRDPDNALYYAVRQATDETNAPPKTTTRIGDCLAPGTIAAAVYAGHRFAQELDAPAPDGMPFRCEFLELASDKEETDAS